MSVAATTTTAHLGVDSEVGTLRRVILSRPGLALERLTPANKDDLLFDDVLWVRRARQEHDAFADALADRGVEVLYLADLLEETLKNDAARSWLIARAVTAHDLGADLAAAVAEWFADLATVDLVRCLIGGVL